MIHRYLKNHPKRTLFISCALLGGIAFLLLFGIENVNPANTNWVVNGGGDNFQHYIGWRFFRNQPWTRYFLFMRNLNYPVGTSVIVTDSNPLFSVLFKLLRNWLPAAFQFNGIWLVTCYALSAGFGALIGWKLTKNYCFSLIFSLFCTLNPVVLQRAMIHDSLAAHWLILAAILNSLYWRPRWNMPIWCLLILLTFSIHAYFLPMIALVGVLQVERMMLEKGQVKRILTLGIACVLTVGFCYYAFGYQYVQPETGSFGELSMNLNAFINPDGMGTLLQDRSTFPLQYEGFNYWGAGLILLSLAGIFIGLANFRKKYWLYLSICGVFLLFALSNQITWDRNVLAVIQLPEWLLDRLSTFRSSGRLGWIYYYLTLSASLYFIHRFATKHEKYQSAAIIFVVLCLGVQMMDLSKMIQTAYQRFRTIDEGAELLKSTEAWNNALTDIDHLAVTDGESDWIDALTLLAADHHLTFNRSANARGVMPVFGGDAVPVSEIVKTGKFENKTLYILLDENLSEIARIKWPDWIFQVDGVDLLKPDLN